MLLPSPYWVSYYEQIRLAGAEPVLLATGCDEGFKISPRLLAKGITPRTKVLVLNSPNNPTGAVYSREELAALAGVILSHEMLVISDEIYEEINYTGLPNTSIAALGPEIKNRTVTLSGCRRLRHDRVAIGYALGDRRLSRPCLRCRAIAPPTPPLFAR